MPFQYDTGLLGHGDLWLLRVECQWRGLLTSLSRRQLRRINRLLHAWHLRQRRVRVQRRILCVGLQRGVLYQLRSRLLGPGVHERVPRWCRHALPRSRDVRHCYDFRSRIMYL